MTKNNKYLLIGGSIALAGLVTFLWIRNKRKNQEITPKQATDTKTQTTETKTASQGTKSESTKLALQSKEDLLKKGYSADELALIMDSEAYKSGQQF